MSRKARENFARNGLAHKCSATNDLPDSFDNPFAALLLHDVTAAAGAQDSFGIERFIVHRQDQNGRFRRTNLKVLDELQAVAGTKGDIDNGYVRLVRLDLGECG